MKAVDLKYDDIVVCMPPKCDTGIQVGKVRKMELDQNAVWIRWGQFDQYFDLVPFDHILAKHDPNGQMIRFKDGGNLVGMSELIDDYRGNAKIEIEEGEKA